MSGVYCAFLSAPLSVLLVDDDDDIREALSEILRDVGYCVDTAENGEDALEFLASAEAPRLILLDMMMPVMNGWQLLEVLHNDAFLAQIPVIVISASHLPEGDVNLGTQVRNIIEKPVSLDRLLDLVATYCGTPAGAK